LKYLNARAPKKVQHERKALNSFLTGFFSNLAFFLQWKRKLLAQSLKNLLKNWILNE